MPSCSFAASDIRSFVHGGSQTTSTFASVTPGTALTLLRDLDRQRLGRRAAGRGQRHADAGDAGGVDAHIVNRVRAR